MLIHIHSYIFIKCYLIHLEKACFLGFIWEFNHRLKLLRLGKAEQTFRKYLLVLCTPARETLWWTQLCPQKLPWGHTSSSLVLVPHCLPPAELHRQTTPDITRRPHGKCSHVHITSSTNPRVPCYFSPGVGATPCEQAVERNRCEPCRRTTCTILPSILCL